MILSIDTASKTATAAITRGNEIIAEYSVVSDKTHSRALIPMIESLFKTTGIGMDDIELFACVSGPGSFTGLRIGAAAAKSFAYACNKQIAAVSALDVLAYGACVPGHTICPIMDARNGYVYTAFYRSESCGDSNERSCLIRLTDYTVMKAADAVECGGGFGAPLYFTGGGADTYGNIVTSLGGRLAPAHLRVHSSAALGMYAYEYRDIISVTDASGFTPVYISRSEQVDKSLR